MTQADYIELYFISTGLLGALLAGYEIAGYSEDYKNKHGAPILLIGAFFGFAIALPILMGHIGAWIHKKVARPADKDKQGGEG